MKKIMLFSSLIMIVISLSLISYHIISANEEITNTPDQITTQTNQIKYLEPYGYTLENPHIILDPYGSSPLTAIIIFETTNEEPTTLTIQGKDEASTFTNTFTKTTHHIIPIYGLYPNYNNQITITCGTTTKTYTITTPALDITPPTLSPALETNQLNLQKEQDIIYGTDINNDIRFLLTDNTTISPLILKNNHLLVASSKLSDKNYPLELLEIDLTGKIYNQYNFDYGYYGAFLETDTSYYILSNTLLELDKQTGNILKEYPIENNNYTSIKQEQNTLILSNQEKQLYLDLTTLRQHTETISTPLTTSTTQTIKPYQDLTTYTIRTGSTFNNTTPTTTSSQKIFLINCHKINTTYKNYQISITKTNYTLEISNQLTSSDTAYLILDKFLDKKIYTLTPNITYINLPQNITGKYSIYIKINNTTYKTNTYIEY